jgi:3-oxoadipate CoA-transferase beta subunit
MEHITKTGASKLVPECTYPLTGIGCVARVYTDLAVIDLLPAGAVVLDIIDGMELEQLQRLTAIPLQASSTLR